MSALVDLRNRLPSGAGLAALVRGLRGRRAAFVCLAVAVVLAAGYLLWLRDSGIVGVDEVSVSGLTSEDAGEIRSALVRTGRGMTSLHVDQEALERAVERFPEVRALEAGGDFPNGLRITVLERRPAALLVAGDSRIAVAGDGTVLSGLKEPGALPEVRAEGVLPAKRLGAGEQFDVVSVLGGAPAALTPKLEKATLDGAKGVVVQVGDGPELRFGNTARTSAKWAAAARVLADEDSAGAEYIDLTIPERPAAGGLAVETVAPAGGEIEPAPAADPALSDPQP